MSIQDSFSIDKWDFERRTILMDLPASDLAMLMGRSTEHSYNKGEVIFHEGTFPSGIYSILNGKVKKYKVDRDGGEHIIYVASTGELLGYHAVLSGETYADSAAVLEESRIAYIPREDFLSAVDRSEVLSRRLLKTLSHEFAVLANSLTVASRRPARERLALQLLIVREKYKPEKGGKSAIEIDLSRDDLANLVGTARENVVRILTEFKEEGILETQGRKIIVRDMRKLIKVANLK